MVLYSFGHRVMFVAVLCCISMYLSSLRRRSFLIALITLCPLEVRFFVVEVKKKEDLMLMTFGLLCFLAVAI